MIENNGLIIHEYSADDCTSLYLYVRNTDIVPRQRGNQGTRYSHYYYKNLVCAFDIETSTFTEKNAPRADLVDNSFCYIWQMSINNDFLIIGRTLESFIDFLNQIDKNLMRDEKLVIYVHNLSYEFQFLSALYRFNSSDVFAIKKRKVLKCLMSDSFEFRCSYLHSNMSLAQYTKKMGVEHQKLSGADFDYEKLRYPWTDLTDYEIAYSIYDVVGLVECLKKEMEMDDDTLYTIPLTSTGYVRRDVKSALKSIGRAYLKNIEIDYHIYVLLKEAFRGGDTHANRYYSGKIIKNAHSADRSSSYPDVMESDLYPMSQFAPMEEPDSDTVLKYLNVYNRALLMRVKISGLCLRDIRHGCPYLTKDKSRNIVGAVFDNGRILECEYLECTLTDVDFRIILKEYTFDAIEYIEVYHARYAPLPQPIKDVINNYYLKKTELKDIDGQEVYYTKSKNKLNSCYGMMAQDVVKQDMVYSDEYEQLFEEATEPPEKLFEKSMKKRFLSYAWGVWVTAWARYALHQAIWIVNDTPDADFLYCDTDSVKYIGDVDFSAFNKKARERSKKNRACARDKHGKIHYMGVYESEKDMLEFTTMGAKKYAYTTQEKDVIALHLTLAGVGKEDGARYLAAHGGLQSFKDGFLFPEKNGGGHEAVYNDTTNTTINIDGHMLNIGRNVCIKDSTYTLGLSADYANLLKGYENYKK